MNEVRFIVSGLVTLGVAGGSAEGSADAHTALRETLELYPALKQTIDGITPEFGTIPSERRRSLRKLALFVNTKLSSGEPAKLTFICTHNSRRSHMGQILAATAAAFYGIDSVSTFSGGTESTAFNPRAVAAMKRAGFRIENPGGDNPHYVVRSSDNGKSHECFSKRYDDDTNPKANFAAVMTCSQADKNCPVVEGAAVRVAIPYVDPKISDGTPNERATYDDSVRQIAREMFYVFSLVKQMQGA